MTATRDLSGKTDREIENWIRNLRKGGQGDSELFSQLLEERARRTGKGLDMEQSIRHLTEAARAGQFTTYGELAAASGVEWKHARHAMNNQGGHLEQLLEICQKRGLPVLCSICVNQQNVVGGMLESTALEGFTKGCRHIGYNVRDDNREAFLRERQQECFAWARDHAGSATASDQA